MSPPIRTPDGNEVSEIVLPDGSTASEVIDPDGNVVFEAGPDIPDSAVLYAEAGGYDGSKWVSDVGSDIPDSGGNPSKTSVTANSTTFDVVRYDASSGDYSQTTDLNLSGRQAILYVSRLRQFQDNFDRYVDGGTVNEFTHLHSSNSPNDPHQIVSSSSNVKGDTFDTNWHVYCFEGESSTIRLFEDSTTAFLSGSNGFDSLTGLTLNAKADGGENTDRDIALIEVLNGHTDSERDGEIKRLKNKYNIS